MTTAVHNTAVYWDLDHLSPGRGAGTTPPPDGALVLLPGSALTRAIDHAQVQRALGGACTIEGLLAQALERAGVELIETCGNHELPGRAMNGFVHIALDDMALNPGIDTVVLVSMRSDVHALASFVTRAGRRFTQLRCTAVLAAVPCPAVPELEAA